MSSRRPMLAAAAAGLAALLGACSTLEGMGGDKESGFTKRWRKVGQVQNRFAIFVNEPGAPLDGDTVHFRMVFVYMPGAVKFEEKEVGWQEYSDVTVDCAGNRIRLGPRSRYAPDGAVIASDDDQTLAPINYGTAADDAARAKCKKDYWVGDYTFKDGPAWMEAARKHIAETPPPKRS